MWVTVSWNRIFKGIFGYHLWYVCHGELWVCVWACVSGNVSLRAAVFWARGKAIYVVFDVL